MYLPKKENLQKLKKLYDNVDWDLEYDKLYLSNKSKNENYNKKHNIITIDNIKEETNADYLDILYDKYKIHIKNGGTQFGFICFLNENKITFRCNSCFNYFLVEDISFSINTKINIASCRNCNNKRHKEWKENNNGKEWQYNYISNRYKNDDIFRFKSNVRQLVCGSFKRNKNNNWKKKTKTESILGCNFDFFRNYIQKQFTEGMTLENYGSWHLDHIKPLALAKTEEDVIILNHYTNFQPLWAEDNYKKGSKYY